LDDDKPYYKKWVKLVHQPVKMVETQGLPEKRYTLGSTNIPGWKKWTRFCGGELRVDLWITGCGEMVVFTAPKTNGWRASKMDALEKVGSF